MNFLCRPVKSGHMFWRTFSGNLFWADTRTNFWWSYQPIMIDHPISLPSMRFTQTQTNVDIDSLDCAYVLKPTQRPSIQTSVGMDYWSVLVHYISTYSQLMWIKWFWSHVLEQRPSISRGRHGKILKDYSSISIQRSIFRSMGFIGPFILRRQKYKRGNRNQPVVSTWRLQS